MATIENPFATIESAHEFLALLGAQIDEALAEARQELANCSAGRHQRRTEAWQLVVFTTTKLSAHIGSSRRVMNDLRMLRNLLHRTGAPDSSDAPDAAGAGPAGAGAPCALSGR